MQVEGFVFADVKNGPIVMYMIWPMNAWLTIAGAVDRRSPATIIRIDSDIIEIVSQAHRGWLFNICEK